MAARARSHAVVRMLAEVTPSYAPGDWVLVADVTGTDKFSMHQGPFEVCSRLDEAHYSIRGAADPAAGSPVNARRLIPYLRNEAFFRSHLSPHFE